YGGWPLSGEIDIFESFQPGVAGPQPTGGANEIHGTLHYGYAWPLNQNSGASYTPPTNIWEEFHTYIVEWEEGEIRWYVDDVLFARNSGNWFRSEEHTSELQSRENLVCRLLLEKK